MLDSWNMKKLLAIVVLGLLWSGSAYSDEPRIFYKDVNKIHVAHKTHFMEWHEDVIRVGFNYCKSLNKYAFMIQTTRGGAPINKYYKQKIKSTYKGSWVTEFICSAKQLVAAPSDSFVPGAPIFQTNFGRIVLKQAEKKKPKTVAKKPEPSWSAKIPEGDYFMSRVIKGSGVYDAPGKTAELSKINAKKRCEISDVSERRCLFIKTWEVKAQNIAKKPGKKITKSADVDNSLITIGSGSGFYINNKGYALTNNHVIDICAQSVAVIDGKETLFRVIATDKTNDVAVLKTDYKSRNYIKINEDGAKLGENVIAVGYPLAGRLSDSVKITRGIVSSLSGLDNNIGQIQIDAALQPGNSGGPVLNENGELVGIASAGLNKLLMAKEAKYIPENVNFAVASPIVVNILKSKKVKYATPSMFSGSFSNTELAELGDSSTIQLFCRNTRTAYNRLKSSNKYSTVLLDLD